MVQHTLEATKTFIFDVRPMVLDDLGIVPTLRRAARDRGRVAQIPVEFDSVGQGRRRRAGPPGRPAGAGARPPARAARIGERGGGAAATPAAAAEAVARAGELPAGTWKAVGQRAHAAGISVALSEDGAELAAQAAYPA